MAEQNSAAKQNNEKNSHSQGEPQKNEAGIGSVLSIIFVAALAAVLFGTVIYSLDRRNTMYSKVSSLTNELIYAKAENVRLQTELESKISAKNVEEYAENVLGMKKIDPSQIKYIEIQTDDVVSIPEQDEGFVVKIKKFFDYCVEYFRG